MSVSGTPESDDVPDRIGQFWQYVHSKPLLHFVVSEVIAGFAAFSVFFAFLAFSYLTERLIETLPLKHSAPAIFLEQILAWAAALSGALTFSVITLCSLVRLGIQLMTRIRQ